MKKHELTAEQLALLNGFEPVEELSLDELFAIAGGVAGHTAGYGYGHY
jgi:hypothetical protein